MENLENVIESVVFVAGEPVLISDLCFKFDVNKKKLKKLLKNCKRNMMQKVE